MVIASVPQLQSTIYSLQQPVKIQLCIKRIIMMRCRK